jgi:murein DD-endopeptidase MepM/ murein hydrolase activator NlpD
MQSQPRRRARFRRIGPRRRFAVHGFIVVLALVAASYAAVASTDARSAAPGIIPTFTISGVAAAQPQGSAFFAPGSSLQTHDSVAAITARPDVTSIRATGAVSPVSSFSSGVAIAAAASGENAGGVRPLADLLDPRQPFALYEAQPGDSVSGIAERYGISVRTLLDNNPTVDDGGLLQLGQQLVVPREDGILHKIGHGETLESIVNQYDNITVGVALEYRPNNISDPENLSPGEYVLLPGATVKPPPPPPPPPPEAEPGSPGQGEAPLPGGEGRFSFPLAAYNAVTDPFGVPRGGGTIHTGIDLGLWGYHHSNIFAACSGVVSRTEYLTYSYGYHVVIDCGDGWSTLYAHLSEILVSPGQPIGAGEILGISGVTGYTTGEHLHFEIRKDGAPVNPAAYLPF